MLTIHQLLERVVKALTTAGLADRRKVREVSIDPYRLNGGVAYRVRVDASDASGRCVEKALRDEGLRAYLYCGPVYVDLHAQREFEVLAALRAKVEAALEAAGAPAFVETKYADSSRNVCWGEVTARVDGREAWERAVRALKKAGLAPTAPAVGVIEVSAPERYRAETRGQFGETWVGTGGASP